MYQLKNGILYQDGKARMCLGLSYYPSYHPKKFPVRPEDDRIGELKKDIREMGEAGFNLVRFAALGELKRVGEGAEGIEVSFPLIDECMKATEQADIAAQVRLQGYTLNVSGYTGEGMITPEGRELGMYECFLRASLNHEGIMHDNEDCTDASARYFAPYPTLVSYQIFNEPAYHHGVDYNPHSIAAWRKWLVEKGLKTAQEAETLEPPRRRPQRTMDPQSGATGDNLDDWKNWRLFHHERLSWYLNHMSEVARKANPNAENMTCLMNCPLTPDAMMLGEDYYRNAEGMEVLAITHYTPCFGESFYDATKSLDAVESAAAVYGKHAWLVEYNARTNMPGNEWDRETYAAVGAGFKGIMYYQWRADYPFPDGPEPDEFGILFNDRRKTAAYHHAVKMNRLINEQLSEKIALAEKYRAGVAVLFSEQANAQCDAMEGSNRTISDGMQHSYRLMRKAGVPVDFTRACDLAQNPLGVKLLIVPAGREYYPAEELKQLSDFRKQGGTVLQFNGGGGFMQMQLDDVALRLMELPNEQGGYTYDYFAVKSRGLHGYLREEITAEEALQRQGIAPTFQVEGAPRLDARVLTGEHYHLVCLTNIDTQECSVPAGKVLSLDCGATEAQRITFFTPDEQCELTFSVENGRLNINLPEIKLGGYVLIEA